MAADPSFVDHLLAFLQALGTHWFALGIGVLLVVEALFSPFRQDTAPEGRRVAMLTMAGVALMVAAFLAFSDEHVTAQRAMKSAESYRDAARTEHDRARSERDNLASQLSGLQKQLDEKVGSTAQPEDGSQQHPFSDKAKCPPGFTVVDSDQAAGGATGQQPKRRDRVCFVITRQAR